VILALLSPQSSPARSLEEWAGGLAKEHGAVNSPGNGGGAAFCWCGEKRGHGCPF
jgi:hypothetical protein